MRDLQSRATQGFFALSRRHYALPPWVAIALLSTVLFFIGWSPMNLNVLRSIFILNDPEYESEFKKLVHRDGSLSPVFRLFMLSRYNLTSQQLNEEFGINEMAKGNLSLSEPLGERSHHSALGEGEGSPDQATGHWAHSCRLMAIEYLMQNSPDVFQQWTKILIFGLSMWMLADVIADYLWNLNPLYGPNSCSVLGPVFFLSSMFCLLSSASKGVKYLGISFLSLSFHITYRSSTGLCFRNTSKRKAVLSILMLSIMCDFSGLYPIFILYRAVQNTTIGSTLRWKMLKEETIAGCLALAIVIGILPATTAPQIHIDDASSSPLNVEDLAEELLMEQHSSDNEFLTSDPYADEDAEDVPFLSSRWSSPIPMLIPRTEGPDNSVCELEHLDDVESEQEREVKKKQEQQKQRTADLREWSGWIVRLFNACVSTHVICWSSRLARSTPTTSFPFTSRWKAEIIDTFDIVFCFSWIAGLLLLFLWSFYGSPLLRELQALVSVFVLLLFNVDSPSTRVAAVILFTLTRSVSFGSVEYAIESFERWSFVRRDKQPQISDGMKLVSRILLPAIHLLMIPYADLMINLMSKRSHDLETTGELGSTLSFHLYADPVILRRVNFIWASAGLCVLVFNIAMELLIQHTQKMVENGLDCPISKKEDLVNMNQRLHPK